MASPAVTRTARPLDGLHFTAEGPPELTGPLTEHLRLLGVTGAAGGPGPAGPGAGRAARVTLSEQGTATANATIGWSAGPAGSAGVTDEATAQAATGIMAVHGRRDGGPRALAVDYAVTATAVLTTQGLLAGLLARARGGRAPDVRTYVDRAGLLVVSQYLAAAGADEGEAAELAPGGPPSPTGDRRRVARESPPRAAGAPPPPPRAGAGRDGECAPLRGAAPRAPTPPRGPPAPRGRGRFGGGAGGAPAEAMRAGWRPFQFRYATACAPFPEALHTTTRACGWQRIREAAAASGAEVCRLRSLAERAAEHEDAAPWHLSPYEHERRRSPRTAPRTVPTPERPLAGLVVLEAGRRVQAPLAAHLLGLLGAEVVRIEPPGGDPLRGMPPACSGVSARWLALNRGKRAVEIDIKSPAERLRLRELAAGADVFLHNWAPGKAAKLGLDSEDLAAVNPGLVYAYTGGWGTGGPTGGPTGGAPVDDYAPMGTDFMVQARTGVGEAARPEGEVPAPSLMTLLDVMGGLLGAEAVLAGLLLRERTGRGVRVDSSLRGAADLVTGPALSRSRRGERARRPAGFRTPLRTADGWIAPADADAEACAAAAAAPGFAGLSTEEALRGLRARGLSATAVTTDLADLHHDPRFAGSISRDAHGAPAVPDPWSFV
ncbi:CoA transferase [Streptomyces sp. NPDC059411]|uniref:CoA transferase n=1 Tax=Streptomyces sp. NPDC059411 TaxID=3346825 RepID=UPI00367677FA